MMKYKRIIFMAIDSGQMSTCGMDVTSLFILKFSIGAKFLNSIMKT